MDFHALMTIAFALDVDDISRAMFAEKLAEMQWKPVGSVAGSWTLWFEGRSRASKLDTVSQHLRLACQRARIERGQIQAVVQFGDDEPLHPPE